MVIIKKTSIMIIMLALIMLCVGNSIFKIEKNHKEELYVVEDESFLNDFKIKGNKVYFNCHIMIKNRKNKDVKFKIKGDFIDDSIRTNKKKALVKQRIIYAEENGNIIFKISSKEKKYFDVVFIGTFAGKKTKKNRLLPQLTLEYENIN